MTRAKLILSCCALYGSSAFGTQATQSPNEQVLGLFKSGQDLARVNRWAEAVVVLREAEHQAPDNVAILELLGSAEGRVGAYAESVRLFRRAVELQPGSATLHVDLALALADSQALPLALEEVDRALALDPQSDLAHRNRGRILQDLKRYKEAATEFQTAQKLSPKDPFAFYYGALLAREMSNLPLESELLQKVVALQPENAVAFAMLGRSLADQSRHAEAIPVLRRAMQLDPASPDPVYLLARQLRASDRPEADRLMRQFQLLKQKDAQLDDIRLLGNQAVLAEQKEDWPGAIRLLRQALQGCSSCSIESGLRRNLGLALCHAGDLEAGAAELHHALVLNPDDVDAAKALKLIGR